ncbi:MAG: ATP-binding cassette domain-containing protein [Flavobacteriaceae bacterium]|nr:ATP-binding cassette domain-containing protein [Flavobacteriaceae bacterium]
MIITKDIYKSFDNTPVLKGISTIFEEGKTSLIIGQSGSGKTIMMKILLGLIKQDSGTVSFGDKISSDLDRKGQMQLRKEIGMVFQGSALFDSMTIEENIMFPIRMFSDESNEQMRHRANLALKRVNLTDVNSKVPSELSGGMQKRVAIARAIVMEPKYLFCDEPNSGLDPKTAVVIDNLIQEITKEYSITTVINTHDMNSVMEIGEKIIFLKQGIKQWEGSNQEIFKTENQSVVDFVYSSNLFKKIRASFF